MKNGMITSLIMLALFMASPVVFAEGEIYKVVDENGNVTFTDQRPSSEAQPMDLPPLSVIKTEVESPATAAAAAQAAAEEAKPPSPRDLRKQFRDFRITRPLSEETFWGTANTVVVTWASSQQIPPSMKVMLYVNGSPQEAPPQGGVSLTLDRGEHQVYAELRDERNRRIITTDPVTFFVKQNSQNFNRPGINPGA